MTTLYPVKPVSQCRSGGWMQLGAGRRFYPQDPRPEDFRIEDIAHALACENRFGGHTPEPYSVAQHSVLVSRRAQELASGSVEVALWGLLHDASEAYIRDLPRPVKRLLPEYQRLEEGVMAAIADRFQLGRAMPPEVRRADEELLATEARDLLGISDRSWGLEAEPLTDLVAPESNWRHAKFAFLDRFRELTESR